MRTFDLAQGKQSPEEAFIDAILFGQQKNPENIANILSFYPAGYNNPFQQILYTEAKKHNFVPLGFTDFEHLGKISWKNSSYIHLHWLKGILEKATSNLSAQKKVGSFEKKLEGLKKRKHKIIWTVHNVLPHGTKYEKHEIKIRSLMASYADSIHSLTTKTYELCEPYFKLPKEKIFQTPHPLYSNFYPNRISKEKARFELNLDTEFVFLFFGSVVPYKNLEFLLSSLSKMPLEDGQKQTVFIVGKPSAQGYSEKLKRLASKANCHVKTDFKKISAEKVQYYFAACDCVLIPYSETLNSGLLALAASFKKPIISGRTSSAEDIYGKKYPFFFEGNNSKDLLKKIEDFKKSTSHMVPWEKVFSKSNEKTVSDLFFQKIKQERGYV